MKDVENAYERVVAEIKGQYHLGYQSTNARPDGAWRKVEVRVKRPGTRVRSRRGYFGPYKPAS
jgi:Ca-activated chloride channel family protein